MGFPNRAVDTLLAQKTCMESKRLSQLHLQSWDLHAWGTLSTNRPSLPWELRALGDLPGTARTRRTQRLPASEMSSLLPLDCARVKLARALIKTCHCLAWGPPEACHPPTSLSLLPSALGGGRNRPIRAGELRNRRGWGLAGWAQPALL